MAINPMKLMQIKPLFDRFKNDHPRVIPFIQACGATGMPVGTIIEAKVTLPDGTSQITNIKLNENDLHLVEALKDINS